MELSASEAKRYHTRADRRQLLLYGRLERGEISLEDYQAEWSHNETRAREVIAGQGMFRIIYGHLFDQLQQADYMRIINQISQDPELSYDERIGLQHELRASLDPTIPLEVFDQKTGTYKEITRMTLGGNI